MYRYTYYPDGSLHAVTKDDGTTPVAYYTYNDAGLLATAGPDVNTTWLTNTWDADNNRVSFTVNSNTHTLVYDITAGIPAVIQEDGVYYYREPNGTLIARQDDETWRLYHFDEIGSTTCLTTLAGTVTDRYTYDPWGNLLTHDIVSDGGTDQPYQYVGRLGYYTHYQQPDFGLLQLGVRYYDPGTGRFTSRDPIGYAGGLNLYQYANGNPVMQVDPTGRNPWVEGICATFCLAEYEGAKFVCGLYTTDKAGCFAIAATAYGICVAGCSKTGSGCTETWTERGHSDWVPVANSAYWCQDKYYLSSHGRRLWCRNCMTKNSSGVWVYGEGSWQGRCQYY